MGDIVPLLPPSVYTLLMKKLAYKIYTILRSIGVLFKFVPPSARIGAQNLIKLLKTNFDVSLKQRSGVSKKNCIYLGTKRC